MHENFIICKVDVISTKRERERERERVWIPGKAASHRHLTTSQAVANVL